MKFRHLSSALVLLSTATQANWNAGVNANLTDINGASSHGYGVHLGYTPLHFLGVEAGINRFGDDYRSGYKTSYDSVSLALKPKYRFNTFSLYGTFGMHAYSGEKDIDLHAMYGFGAEAYIHPRATAGAEYNFYRIGISDIEALMFKVSYLF